MRPSRLFFAIFAVKELLTAKFAKVLAKIAKESFPDYSMIQYFRPAIVFKAFMHKRLSESLDHR